MRKPNFCICENKDADQRLCFRYPDSKDKDKEALFNVAYYYVSPEGLGDILFFPGRPSVRLSVTNRVRSVT